MTLLKKCKMAKLKVIILKLLATSFASHHMRYWYALIVAHGLAHMIPHAMCSAHTCSRHLKVREKFKYQKINIKTVKTKQKKCHVLYRECVSPPTENMYELAKHEYLLSHTLWLPVLGRRKLAINTVNKGALSK
jgi:hypothetical protein